MPSSGHPDWHALLPGVYDDGRGGLHIVLNEFLAAHGYADTPANRATLLAAVHDQFPGAVVEEDA